MGHMGNGGTWGMGNVDTGKWGTGGVGHMASEAHWGYGYTVPKYRAAVDYTPRLRAPRNLPRCMANSDTYRQ